MLTELDLANLGYYVKADAISQMIGDDHYYWGKKPDHKGNLALSHREAFKAAAAHAMANAKPRRCVECGQVSSELTHRNSCQFCSGQTHKMTNGDPHPNP